MKTFDGAEIRPACEFFFRPYLNRNLVKPCRVLHIDHQKVRIDWGFNGGSEERSVFPWELSKEPNEAYTISQKEPRFRDIQPFVRDGQWECNFSLARVIPWLEEMETRHQSMDMNPDFQRPHVWTESQQIAWIEYILRGGRSGRVLYFNHPGWDGDYVGIMTLVDGKQRIEAIRRFMLDEFKVFGWYRSQYLDNLDTVHDRSVRINVNALKSRADMIRWYIGMNDGGTPHTVDEIEKAKRLLAIEVEKERTS